ncbi:GNAT family N-acetyltransferase [Fictibacillus gelatini]|uniref:GNAT family N-acetyltransferase n=1 Tax=Fictibacillus gelatini TaxID=225985 RepID=UPI0004799C2F|nr:GNAT family N-acetyltransferase [Fictibacillus gelatini]
MIQIKEITDNQKEEIKNLMIKNWGSTKMVSRGIIHDLSQLPGYVAAERDEIQGIITYHIYQDECEIVSLDSFQENRGIGSRLLDAVIEKAKRTGCGRVWLITTNDNLHAMGFYQKRHFSMKALHLNAVNDARKLKPEIPLYSEEGIPIMHEIEFERLFI